MQAIWKKAAAAAIAAATLVTVPFAVQADQPIFLSNPAAGGAFPTQSGRTSGTGSHRVNFSASLGNVFIFGLPFRRMTLSTTPVNAGSLVATWMTLPCSGGALGASSPSPGYVLSSGTQDNLSLTCPFGQTTQTGWGNVDVF